jgi:hypothetical protein
MLTNGQAWAGYENPETMVPTYPLRTGAPRSFELSGVGVWDSSGKWIATFRNHEDAQSYVADGVKRAAAMDVARKAAYDNSPIDAGDDDRTLCRVCLKYFSSAGIGQHTKAKHAMKLGKMLNLKVPTEREYRAFLAAKAGVPA